MFITVFFQNPIASQKGQKNLIGIMTIVECSLQMNFYNLGIFTLKQY
jgi:hypothetical protein